MYNYIHPIIQMKHLDYIPQGVCSRCIHLTMTDDHCVESVGFEGGCHGNLQGISSLVRGMKAEDVLKRLKGIRCGNKDTSCPDQLCQAIESLLSE